MVDAENVRLPLAAAEGLDLFPANAGSDEQAVHLVIVVDGPAQEIEAQPAPLIFEIRLVAERRGREAFAKVLGLDELRVRDDLPDRPHRLEHALALVDQRSEEERIILGVWIPMAVEGGKTRRRQRLVHRRPHLDPGVPLRHARGVIGQLLRKVAVQQLGVARPGSVMGEAADDADAALAKH